MLRLLAASLAGLLLCLPTGHAAQLGFHCTITYGNTGASDIRTIHIDTGARSVRDNEMVTVDGAANAIARNQVEFVDTDDQRVAWGSRLRATGASVFTIAIDLRTRRYTFVSQLQGLRAHGTCQPSETPT
jgi:hypothetical protein